MPSGCRAKHIIWCCKGILISFSLYVHGARVYDSDEEVYEECESFFEELQTLWSLHSVSHFYIAEDGDSGNIHVTVSNVLLYNHALEDRGIKALMKTNAVAALEARMPDAEGAPPNSHLSQPFPQLAVEPVSMHEVQQKSTSPPQRQDSPSEISEDENRLAVPRQTSSTDSTGSSTSAARGEVEEVVPSSVDSVSVLFPTAGGGSRQKLSEIDEPVSGDHFEGEQEHSSLSVVAPMTGHAYEAAEATPQREATEDRTQHSILSHALEDVEELSPHSATLAGEEQNVGPEGRKNTNPHTAVGADGGPDKFHSAEVTPVEGATAAPEPSTGPATAQGHDKVLDGIGTDPTHPSTAPGETYILSEFNATSLSDTDILLEHGHFGELAAMALSGDARDDRCGVVVTVAACSRCTVFISRYVCLCA
ncbi:trans-sialidase, putative [Trypanosoma cruzi marinkellei]|uniref:Trans-sialidase, putative n=1 Tax=Trypanosoma cruzi marinkellei TaxID=85056 RepID=K2MR83_TRYCR|nr:trans-sialidase, putative [Trypanosoma cruzi marinkellei]